MTSPTAAADMHVLPADHDSYEAGPAEAWRQGQHDDLVLALALGVWTGEYLAAQEPVLDLAMAAAGR